MWWTRISSSYTCQYECNFICSTTLNTFRIMYSSFYSIFISKNNFFFHTKQRMKCAAMYCTFYKLRSILRFVIYYKHRRHQLFFFCSILISCDVVLFFVSLKSHINWKIQPFYCLNKRFLLLLSLCLIKQTDHFNINAKLVHFIHASVLHGFLVYLMWFFFFLL